ncbi:MAG: septal ring lytic transglycosylase RlpA family protein [Alphaproteobacteria bacterium]
MLKKTLSVVALLAIVGCQHNTPVRTWNSPEASNSGNIEQTSQGQMPTENMPANQLQEPMQSSLNMHPSVMGAPVGTYKIGKPYTVDGSQYTPAENYGYQAEGMASWYGGEFAGQKTANGAIFNPQAYTAAHKTLPLPSVVKITNNDNGKVTYARVNDRGPFSKNRIIDVSEAVAEELGMKANGTAHLKVELMEAESKQLKEMAMANGGAMVSQPVQDSSGLNPSEQMPSQSVASGNYFVQAGALASNANAETMKSQIQGVGSTSVINEGGYFKVRVGPFSSIDQAIQAKNSLSQYGISNPGLIKNGKWARW